MWQMMVEKEVCKQQSPFDWQNSNNSPLFFFKSTHPVPPLLLPLFLSSSSRFVVRSHSYQVGAFRFCPVSGYGTVSSTCPATALLLFPQTDPLTLVFTLPKPRSLEDLLHKLLKGTLNAIFGLCTGLCTKERGLPRFMRSEHFPKCYKKNNKPKVSF